MSYLLWNSYNKWLSYDLSVYFVFCMQEGTSSSTVAKMKADWVTGRTWRNYEKNSDDNNKMTLETYTTNLKTNTIMNCNSYTDKRNLTYKIKHRQARQDLIDMYETELQKQDAEIQRLTCKRQLLHQQQMPSQQLTRQQDESKDLLTRPGLCYCTTNHTHLISHKAHPLDWLWSTLTMPEAGLKIRGYSSVQQAGWWPIATEVSEPVTAYVI